jgi:hypothetical protein
VDKDPAMGGVKVIVQTGCHPTKYLIKIGDRNYPISKNKKKVLSTLRELK